MATNDELAIVFMCLATRADQENFIEYMANFHPEFTATENGVNLIHTIRSSSSMMPIKINNLHVYLGIYGKKNKVIEEMANRAASICAALRLKEPPTAAESARVALPAPWTMPI
jgi:hypothetical protein